MFNNHQNVSASGWQAAGVGLPSPEDIPNIDLHIVNFHRPPLGTFHSKFMIVDRQIATCSSHNIQDNDNLESKCHSYRVSPARYQVICGRADNTHSDLTLRGTHRTL